MIPQRELLARPVRREAVGAALRAERLPGLAHLRHGPRSCARRQRLRGEQRVQGGRLRAHRLRRRGDAGRRAVRRGPLRHPGTGLVTAAAAAPGVIDYDKQVHPFLKDNCIACHNKTTTKGGLNMETPVLMIKGGETDKGLIPGKGAKYRLWAEVKVE